MEPVSWSTFVGEQADPVILFDWKLMETWRTGVQWWWALDKLAHSTVHPYLHFLQTFIQRTHKWGRIQATHRAAEAEKERDEKIMSRPIAQQQRARLLQDEYYDSSSVHSSSLSAPPAEGPLLWILNLSATFLLPKQHEDIYCNSLSLLRSLFFHPGYWELVSVCHVSSPVPCFHNYFPLCMCFASILFWPLTLTNTPTNHSDPEQNKGFTEDAWLNIINVYESVNVSMLFLISLFYRMLYC